jgi:HEAT repeat protein
MLLFRYREVKRGLRELEAVKDDRRATLALLAKARADDAPPDLRMLIVQKLGNHAGAETIEVLSDVLKNEPHWRVRAAATVALGNIHDPRARELLDEAAKSDRHRRVRENARFNRDNPMAFPRL